MQEPGAERDRLVDLAAALLARSGWEVVADVRVGSDAAQLTIDLLAVRPDRRAALVIIVTTHLAPDERLDSAVAERVRLAPGLVAARFGWRPAFVGRIVALPDRSRLRRSARVAAELARAFPDRGLAVRRWIVEPDGPLSALWFVAAFRASVARERHALSPRSASHSS